MNRSSFLFITLPALCCCLLLSGQFQAQAGTVPVLQEKAKKTVHSGRAPQRSASLKNSIAVQPLRQKKTKRKNKGTVNCPVILGSRGDISAVKKRVAAQAKESISNKVRRFGKTFSRKASRLSRIAKQITSKSVVILDAKTGKTIFAQAPDNPRQPASTIKVLTGIIAMKRLKRNDKVEVSRHAEGMPRSKVYLSSKKEYKADDLIDAVLLASANDASVALAEKIAGSENAFAKLMTMHARLWGAENTVCRTASGLTAKGQHSTARDLARIFRRAMRDKEFARRMKRTKVKTSYGKLLRNHNRALWQVDGAQGGKTGYTSLARQTYVGQFERGDDAIIVAIMGSETMWRDIRRLVEYGFQKKEEIRVAQLAGKTDS
ncbi:MAG: D-alanyl-D-alanine carboxypeptidase family protein [Candidatus Electrothrix sp. YB6]